MEFKIPPIEYECRLKTKNNFKRNWNDRNIVVHSEKFYLSQLLGIKAVHQNRSISILHLLIQIMDCEIISLASLIENQRITKRVSSLSVFK